MDLNGVGLKEPFFEFEIAPLMDILTALVLAFAFGIALQKLFEKGKRWVR